MILACTLAENSSVNLLLRRMTGRKTKNINSQIGHVILTPYYLLPTKRTRSST